MGGVEPAKAEQVNTEQVKVELPEIKPLSVSDVTTAPENNVELKTDAIEPKEDTPKAHKATVTKHVVAFIGNGVWFDSHGIAWSKKTGNPGIVQTQDFTEDEYNEREDIKFMVEYGTMTDTVISL